MLKPSEMCGKGYRSVLSVIVLFIILCVPSLYLISYLYYQGRQNGISDATIRRGFISPRIDGIIEESEWIRGSLYNDKHWLYFQDTDPSAARSGWGFLNVGQDREFVYIALDMCEVFTNLTEETIEVHIITNGKYFTTPARYFQLQGFGVECLVISVSTENSGNVIVFTDEKNTIESARIAIGYHESVNSKNKHRCVEIGIPRSSLRDYSGEGEIGLLVIGKYLIHEYYYSASSVLTNITYYDSSSYIGITMKGQ